MGNEDWFTVGVQGVGWIISTYEYREGFIDSDAYKTYAPPKYWDDVISLKNLRCYGALFKTNVFMCLGKAKWKFLPCNLFLKR